MGSLQHAMPTTANRSAKYDNLKGLLIFLVIFGHALRPYMAGDELSIFLYIFIYSFHMPAFIFIMGKFIKPKWQRIGKFALLYLIMQPTLTIFLNYICHENVSFSVLTPQWILWFLLATIGYTLFSFLLTEHLDATVNKVIFVCSCLLAIFVGFDAFVGEELALSRIVVFAPFFLAGKFDYFARSRKAIWPILCFVGAALLVLVYIVLSSGNYNALYMITGYEESNSAWYLRLFVLTAAFGFIRFLVYSMPDKRIPILTDVGKHTLFIFIGHGFVVKGILGFYKPQIPVLYAFLFSIGTLLGLWGMAVAVDQIKKRFNNKQK